MRRGDVNVEGVESEWSNGEVANLARLKGRGFVKVGPSIFF